MQNIIYAIPAHLYIHQDKVTTGTLHNTHVVDFCKRSLKLHVTLYSFEFSTIQVKFRQK